MQKQKDSISVSHFLEKWYFKGKLWKQSKCPVAVLVVGFIFWEVFPSCVCVSVCIHARLLPGRSGCQWVSGVSVGPESWGTAAEQSTSRSPGCSWSLRTPTTKRGVAHAGCSSESGWSPVCLRYRTLSLTWCLGFFVSVLGVSRRSEKVKPPPLHPTHPPNGSMKPFMLLSSPFPVSPSSPAPTPESPSCCCPPLCVCEPCAQAAAASPHFQPSCFLHLDQLPRLPAAPPSPLQPHFCMRTWCRDVFWLLGRGPSPYRPQCRVKRERRIFIRNWFYVVTFLLCFVLFGDLFCFGLSVQDLQLLKSALPLIKPCSLQPDLCVDGFFSTLKENPA